MIYQPPRKAFTLAELAAVTTILGVLAVLVLPRVAEINGVSDKAACQVYRGDIEIQTELWQHRTGSWPAANLSDIGLDTGYFPAGLPTCPVDGSPYTIDAFTGLVVGHNH